MNKKRRKRSWLSLLKFLAGTLLACFLLLLFVDVFLNGFFADAFESWFTGNFVRTGYNETYDEYYSTIYWGAMREFLTVAFCTLALVIAFFYWIFSRRYAKKRSREQLEEFAAQVETCLSDDKSDPSIFSKEFASIGFEIWNLRSRVNEKETLLKQEMQQKNDLITYLAHDLKTPLASVIGYLCLLDESPSLPSNLREQYIGITLEKSYRLEQLINEFFEITRYNLHDIVVNPGRVHLKPMLLQMADEFFPILESEGKKITVDAPSDLVIIGDADKLARVFNNILKNAAAYSYPDTEIQVSFAEQGDEVLLRFTNQGDPIPERQRETIFEKFYRLDSSRSTKTGGSGLGLAIAKDIVTAHHGKIWVESSLDGTTFFVRLPVNVLASPAGRKPVRFGEPDVNVGQNALGASQESGARGTTADAAVRASQGQTADAGNAAAMRKHKGLRLGKQKK